ncbi:hypothetical protein Taro_014105 [Colocasia esculenta]|uniref:Uncharacterized protein n=1 Tax=Colocasia esculenta TaxID=4460 RepID=A0A843UDM2_COLES|nr:hypothetical protein [Colocasia esculenta]
MKSKCVDTQADCVDTTGFNYSDCFLGQSSSVDTQVYAVASPSSVASSAVRKNDGWDLLPTLRPARGQEPLVDLRLGACQNNENKK